ncbi:hypothetical protein Asp14428_01670 [Actinoplanes sp. NBRC 14428]|nr:hypothetical protein Asp14428_01670 [Actinoplanes sp. NBRC 14428]
MTTLDPLVAREAWRLAEPLHSMVYFVPEGTENFEALGISARAGYFAARGGVFGPVGPGPVVATFYNFKPGLVARFLPAVWETTTPQAAIGARLAAADAALIRGLGDTVRSDEMAEAARLARRAAESAAEHPAGRALYAAHAELDWPDEPHLVLWHAQTLLREFRGDGHVAALLLAEVSGLQAIILHTASGKADGGFLRASRGGATRSGPRRRRICVRAGCSRPRRVRVGRMRVGRVRAAPVRAAPVRAAPVRAAPVRVRGCSRRVGWGAR